ncbi:DsbA family protein [Candidatus Falkowbacteria bacterium]|nr:DsbA family protein [Candidatus Falkowbacteria bacterium]
MNPIPPEQHDDILQSLTQEDVRPTSFFGSILKVIGIGILFVACLFALRVAYYYVALRQGNVKALEGVFVDATGYSKYGEFVSRNDVESYDDPSYGPTDAKLVIVEFGDFGCPYCKENYPVVRRLMSEYSDRVKFIYRDLPLVFIHPQAMIAAQAAQCAHDQGKFWEYHDYLYEHQGMYTTNEELIGYARELGFDEEKFSTCVTTEKYKNEVQQDLSAGVAFKIKGTPTYFINGLKLNGTVSYETFKQLIEKYLERL